MKKYYPLIISVIIGIGLFIIIITPPSFINFIPFALHEALLKEIVSEGVFIVMFNVLISCILAYLLYKILRKFIKSG
ncbi:MAG: hypothetical protein N4A72_20205 [Bacteroidales bacterium]|jgi:hypothetical protein|nr:hypothetical protein [Bacteroidales bacterium]